MYSFLNFLGLCATQGNLHYAVFAKNEAGILFPFLA